MGKESPSITNLITVENFLTRFTFQINRHICSGATRSDKQHAEMKRASFEYAFNWMIQLIIDLDERN